MNDFRSTKGRKNPLKQRLAVIAFAVLEATGVALLHWSNRDALKRAIEGSSV